MSKEKKTDMAEVTGAKDFYCQFNGHKVELKAGEKSSVPKVLLANLRKEKAIK